MQTLHANLQTVCQEAYFRHTCYKVWQIPVSWPDNLWLSLSSCECILRHISLFNKISLLMHQHMFCIHSAQPIRFLKQVWLQSKGKGRTLGMHERKEDTECRGNNKQLQMREYCTFCSLIFIIHQVIIFNLCYWTWWSLVRLATVVVNSWVLFFFFSFFQMNSDAINLLRSMT